MDTEPKKLLERMKVVDPVLGKVSLDREMWEAASEFPFRLKLQRVSSVRNTDGALSIYR